MSGPPKDVTSAVRPDERTSAARVMMLALLTSRSSDKTVCPSEVARSISPETDWRDAMALVHEAVDRLLEDGKVRLSWKGNPLPSRAGPYRIGLPDPDRGGGSKLR